LDKVDLLFLGIKGGFTIAEYIDSCVHARNSILNSPAYLLVGPEVYSPYLKEKRTLIAETGCYLV